MFPAVILESRVKCASPAWCLSSGLPPSLLSGSGEESNWLSFVLSRPEQEEQQELQGSRSWGSWVGCLNSVCLTFKYSSAALRKDI